MLLRGVVETVAGYGWDNSTRPKENNTALCNLLLQLRLQQPLKTLAEEFASCARLRAARQTPKESQWNISDAEGRPLVHDNILVPHYARHAASPASATITEIGYPPFQRFKSRCAVW